MISTAFPRQFCLALIIAASLSFTVAVRPAKCSSFNVIHRFAPFPQGGGQQSSLIQASDGNFYGASRIGGAYGAGALYRMTPDGVVTILHSFNGCDGGQASQHLLQAADGNFYGTTLSGGTFGKGVLYKLTLDGSFTLVHEFGVTQYDGKLPQCPLATGADGNIYGTTNGGGSLGKGTFYRLTAAGVYTTLHDFGGSTNGWGPSGALALAPDGIFYGTTQFGPNGAAYSTIYRVTTDGAVTTISASDINQKALDGVILGSDGNLYGYAGEVNGSLFQMTLSGTLTWLYNFGTVPGIPMGVPVQAADGYLYGVTPRGGAYGYGTVFRMSTSGTLTTLYSMQPETDGTTSFSGLVIAADGGLYGLLGDRGPQGIGTAFRITTGGAFTVVHAFGPLSDGQQPYGGLIQGADGYLYGTAAAGGAKNSGIVFRMDTAGNISPIHSFTSINPDGGHPNPNLVFGPDGNLYGTTLTGGYGMGVVYRLTLGGAEIILHTFSGGTDGGHPAAGLILGSDGVFYGTDTVGGSSNFGVVFRIDSAGTFTTLAPLQTNGQVLAPLTQGADGTLYGVDISQNAGESTIFHLAGSNTLSIPYTFPVDIPAGGLLLAPNGNFYGVASGGAYFMTPTGVLTYFKQFSGYDQIPTAGLTLGSDGSFYGLFDGQVNRSIYNLTVSGSMRTLYDFKDACGGDFPRGNLLLATDGNLYGTTLISYNTGGEGSVFQVSSSIQPPTLTSIVVTPASTTVVTGGTQQFTATAFDQNGKLMAPQPAFIWTASGGGTINGGGQFTAGALVGGPYAITASSGLVSGAATVTIIFVPALTSISVSPASTSVGTSATQQYTATARDQYGDPMPSQPIFAWTVSGGGTINASGLFTANSTTGGGPYTVSAASGSKSGSASITVIFVPVVTSITVSPTSATVNANATQQFTAVAMDQTGNPMPVQPTFAWTVSGGGAITNYGLFTAGGSAGGPYMVTATSGAISGVAPVTVAAVMAPIADFNGDGYPDLVLRNASSNGAALWYIKNAALIGGAYVSVNPPAEWRICGAADFNGDGKSDLILQNSSTNKVAIWYMNGPTRAGGAYVSATPASGWNVIGARDFNGDGKPDLLLQNTVTNRIALWYLNGASLVSGQYVSLTVPTGWNLVGAGDFNGDGIPDVVLENTANNKVAIWYLNATATVTGSAYLSSAPPTGWSVVAAADYNKDGKTDLVLQGGPANKIALWYLNGTVVTGGAYVNIGPAAGWVVVGPR